MQDTGYFGSNTSPFPGRYIDIMPELKEQGLTPVTPAMVMDRRIEAAKNKDKMLIEALWKNYFDTGYGLAATEESIYLNPNSSLLLDVNQKTRLVSYGIPLSKGEIGNNFKISSRKEHILNRQLTEKQARQHKLWLELADNNQERLDSYVEHAFRFGKDEHSYEEMMGFYATRDSQPTLRAVCLGRLGDRSDASGSGSLGGNDARLVGVKGGIGTVGSDDAKNFSVADLERIVSQFGIRSEDELIKALKLYDSAKKLKI